MAAHDENCPSVPAAPAGTEGVVDQASSVALGAHGLVKTFAGATALAGVDLAVQAGTIHALLGGNGSGKSTLIKCLAGVYQADAGTITVHGEDIPVRQMTPRRAREAGLRFVHQDLGLFDGLTVAENFGLDSGFPVNKLRGIRWEALRRRVDELLASYGIEVRATDPVGTLRPSQKTMVAVARALADQQDSEFALLLDEPTASLPEDESRELMAALRARANRGQTIVLVTHRFREISEVADDVTVFRDGRVAGRGPVAEMSTATIVEMMSGAPRMEESSSGTNRPVHPAQRNSHPDGSSVDSPAPLFEATNLSSFPLSGVNLTVAPGEILGLAGLAGSGRSTVLRAIFGDAPLNSGSMNLNGVSHQPSSPADAVRSGIAYVPENRHRDAAFLDLPVRENVSATVIARYWRRFVMNRRLEREETQDLILKHSVRTDGTEQPISRLSGGNQQKVILARWLRRNPRLLLLDEPTQGVDVMSRRDIYRSLRSSAAQGCGVLVASSDLDELAEICDRVLVLVEGRVAAELIPEDSGRDVLAAAVMSAAPDHPAPQEGP
ncbi:sugar ABC transporter ATP-binding protein [Arthrobacter caoxuetaonis]|uniref:Sugar ABC transporter ATP-binding protein n=1 Tax=Arthrobacter caoxuetaonis TaxID=2886935 RepID=A0A9X1MGA5_9MICC|nr:sugar ABC transporter ATP-binding protein [Arthrobacter caoxuetaonis]MCC3283265.1 sugar ABC transporter ATP-binding protein [Arthrobacter caoxuetaonis]MCC3298387.1 sugar ABC transporter ATP-binding protein [Arthrobacter caoxuetaonis]USQ57597.1 sugar ABC transporter ATP-binding protein [Arthrobacter caoxuetaonis]